MLLPEYLKELERMYKYSLIPIIRYKCLKNGDKWEIPEIATDEVSLSCEENFLWRRRQHMGKL